ncbi:MAG: tRNA(His) guanylyltransferase Thg1 family protein [Planctomycetota bacterium]
MKADAFAARVRAGERWAQERVAPGAWTILRVDGRGFSRLTAEAFEKPCDPRFHRCLRAVSRALMEQLQGSFAYAQSDEVSLLLPPDSGGFGRRVEKLASLAAGLASAVFTQEAGVLGAFDGRVWEGSRAEDVVDYLRWRQADALRCSLSNACYWTLRHAGLSARAAGAELEGASAGDKRALLAAHGVRLDALPAWQRRGVGLRWIRTLRPAEGGVVERRRLIVDERLPTGASFSRYLERVLEPETV